MRALEQVNGKSNGDSRLREVLAPFRGSREELIPILQRVQSEYGYLPEREMVEVARFTRVPESRVYGVATFYAQFRFTPMGRNRIMVCRGTACHVKGARRILEEIGRHLGIDEGETTADREYTLETVACIGACSLSPCVMVNQTVSARMTPKKVEALYGKGSRS